MARYEQDYTRGQRLGELLREIIAEELLSIDDERLKLVTITGVKVDRDLSVANVYFSSLDLNPEHESRIGEVLSRYRRRFGEAIGTQAYVRRVPALRFHPDSGVQAGARVEEILRSLRRSPESEPPEEPFSGPD